MNKADTNGATPLFVAALKGKTDCVSRLLQRSLIHEYPPASQSEAVDSTAILELAFKSRVAGKINFQ